MFNLDVCKKESGKLWHRKPSPNDDGLVLSITNSISSALSLHSRNVRFLHAAFDNTGDSFIAGDYQGNVFKFDINRNRFTLVQRTGNPCSALAFALRRRTEFLVAMSDYSLKCFDTDTKELVAWMKGHESVINHISLHTSGRYAITSSNDTAQLWDLDTFQRKRKLNIKENVGLVKVFFLPLSNTIITCFKDDSIFAWESDTLNCKYQLRIPEGQSPRFKAFAVSRDGHLLVGGGRSRYLHVWGLDTHKILQIIELPKKITCVRQLEFLSDSFDGGSGQILGILGQDDIMRFININSYKQLFDIGSLDERIHNVSVAPNGRHIAAVMDNGNINVYDVGALTAELNKPPPPLVKVLKGNKMADTTGTSQETATKKSGRRPVKRIAGKENKASSGDTNESAELPDGMNMDKLYAILKGYGAYPDKYRMFIWRSVLRLPENHAAYGALVDKGTHPAYANIHEKYPIKSRKLLRVLQRVLSALAHWSPIFGETDFLPVLAFPFVKLFQNNQLVCFEIVAAVLTNWSCHWFEYFPNPPINMLGLIENVLAFHDKELLQHFVRYGVTTQTYAWPLLSSLFSEVLTREEWLHLFDNVFSNHPSFLLMAVVSYCVVSRGPLLQCTEFDDFKYFFHHRNAVDVKQLVKETYHLLDTTDQDVHPQAVVDDFVPLTRGQYPVFNKYPKFIVDYQVQERERIRQDEMEYVRQRQVALELSKETQQRQSEEEAWYRQQQLLKDAEENRRKLIAGEEQKLTDQRQRLNAMNRELKMKELQLLDATRRKFLSFQQQQKETELARLDDEIRRKALLREVETKGAIEEADIKNMELQLQRKMLEQEMFREYADQDQKQKAEYDARRHQVELEEKLAKNLQDTERDRELALRKTLQQGMAHTDQLNLDAGVRTEVEYRQRVDDLERERKEMAKARLTAENRRLEEQVHHLMREVEKKKAGNVEERYAELGAQQYEAKEAEARRLLLLEGEVDMARQHVHHIENTQDDMFGRLRDLRASLQETEMTSRHGGQPRDMSQRPYLNDTTSTEQSVQLSLDRGRLTFDNQERELMDQVMSMRQRIARDSRNKHPPPNYGIEI